MGALIGRFLPSLLPGLGAFANPWVLMVILAVAGGVWFHGYATGRDKLDDYIGQQATEAAKIIVKQGEATERVITRYVKVKGDTLVVRHAIEKEVIRYVDSGLDSCPLSRAAVSLHDSAALNAVPDAARSIDGTASGLKTAALTGACTANYALYHETANRLRGLQDWVKQQAKVSP